MLYTSTPTTLQYPALRLFTTVHARRIVGTTRAIQPQDCWLVVLTVGASALAREAVISQEIRVFREGPDV